MTSSNKVGKERWAIKDPARAKEGSPAFVNPDWGFLEPVFTNRLEKAAQFDTALNAFTFLSGTRASRAAGATKEDCSRWVLVHFRFEAIEINRASFSSILEGETSLSELDNEGENA